jgi:hypothetical protein
VTGFVFGAAAMALAASAYFVALPSTTANLIALIVCWLLAVAVVVTVAYLAVSRDRAIAALAKAEDALRKAGADRDA